MTANETPAAARPSLGDRIRREWFLTRVDWYLDSLVPSGDRKRIVSALRDDIAAESFRHGLGATLAGLGDPKALAQSYTDETTRPRPKWARGIIAAGAALFLYWIVFFAYTLGMLAVVRQAGIGQAESRFLFIDVTAFADESGFGIGWGGGVAWLLVPLILVALVLILTSRAWRVLARKS